MSKFKVEPWGP